MSRPPSGTLSEIVVTHENADADGVASMVALSMLRPGLRIMIPHGFDPQSRALWEDNAASLPPLLTEADLATVLKTAGSTRLLVADTSRAARLGPLAPHVGEFAEVLAFDTHPPAPNELPRSPLPQAGSCAAALACELHARGIVPDPVRAGVILVGIHVDTGHFTFPGTTAVDHQGAAHCLAWGADAAFVTRYAARGFSTRQLRLMDAMARSTEQLPIHGQSIALLTLETDDYEPELGSLLTQLREAERWPTALLLTSTAGRIWVIARTDGTVDAQRLLQAFGGGGHREAASAVVTDMGLRDLRSGLREALLDQLGTSRTALQLAVGSFVGADARAPAADVAEKLHCQRINALPLYEDLSRDEGGGRRWIGQVSRQEIDAALRHDLGSRPAIAFSARPPGWVAADAPLSQVRETLLHGRGRIWLVGSPNDSAENGGAQGLLTRTTVLRSAAEPALAGARKPPHFNVIRGKLKASLGPVYKTVRAIGVLASERNMRVYLVGGGVRDLLLDRPVRDVDIVVQGSAPLLAHAIAERFGGEVVVHEAFQTAKWVPPEPGAEPIDLASTRGEHYVGRAELPYVHEAELRQDLFRRDFSINAMALDLGPDEFGQILDPYGGWTDLQAGILRVLHGLSFHDDPTRALRAARFAARFGMRLASGTRGLLDNALSTGALAHLGRERLGNELERILLEDTADRAVELLAEWRLDRAIHDGLRIRPETIVELRAGYDAHGFALGMAATEGGTPPTASDVGWVILGRAFTPEARVELVRVVPGPQARRDRFVESPDRVETALQRLRKTRMHSYTARVLDRLDRVEWVAALALARGRAEADLLVPHLIWWRTEGRQMKSAVDGDWLKEQGLPPGPLFAKALLAARKVVWDGGTEVEQQAAALEVFSDEPA